MRLYSDRVKSLSTLHDTYFLFFVFHFSTFGLLFHMLNTNYSTKKKLKGMGTKLLKSEPLDSDSKISIFNLKRHERWIRLPTVTVNLSSQS